MSKILIIDGNSIASKYFYGVKNSRLGLTVTSDGVPNTISTGFPQSLNKLLNIFNPTHLAICFDPPKKTFRHRLYPEYKANRIKTRDNFDSEVDYQAYLDEKADFKIDMRNLQLILREMNIKVLIPQDCEADDMIASLTQKLINNKLSLAFDNKQPYSLQIIISTGDKDLLQLVDDSTNIKVAYNYGQTNKVYTEQDVINEYGIKPHQLPIYKALVGDRSDNIPGIEKIGRITATSILTNPHIKYPLIDNLNLLPITIHKKLQPHITKFELYKTLTTLKMDLELPFILNDFAIDIIKESNTLETLKK